MNKNIQLLCATGNELKSNINSFVLKLQIVQCTAQTYKRSNGKHFKVFQIKKQIYRKLDTILPMNYEHVVRPPSKRCSN